MPTLANLSLGPEPRFRWRLVLGAGLALGALHVLVLRRLPLGEAAPDLFTLAALFFGLFGSRHGRYLPCLVLGAIRDFASIGLLFSYAVLYGLLHKFCGYVREKLDPENLFNVLVLCFSGVFLVNFGYHVMFALAGDGIGWWRSLERCLMIGLTTAPLALGLFPLAHAILFRLEVPRAPGGRWAI